MRYLLWWVAAILFLALVNAVASWFGQDIAAAGGEPDAHEQAPKPHANAPAVAHAPAPHSPH